MIFTVCVGLGAYDTRSPVLSDGRANPSPSAGTPYPTATVEQVFDLIREPVERPKDEAPWMIPSSYNGMDARSHDVQRQLGQFAFMCIDIDQGNPTLEQVQAGLQMVLGADIRVGIYSTKSSTEQNKKWRALIPVSNRLPGEVFSSYQTALHDGVEAAGLIPDRSLERPAQLVYLPNRGAWYQNYIGGRYILHPQEHPMAGRAAYYQEMRQEAGSGTARVEGARSHLAAFRRKHSIEDLMRAYGYVQRGNSDHWRSPYQDSNSYATQNLGDGWFSLSQSDADAGLGRPAAKGRYGDQFDLYVHFSCNGNVQAAESYARACLQEEDDAVYGDATASHGAYLWDAICRAFAAESMRRHEDLHRMALAESEGSNDEWKLGWPPGAVGELAKWIYASSSRPVKQYSVAAALYFMSVSGRKFNVNGTGLNLFIMLVGGTGRGKGVVKAAIDRVVDSIVRDSEDPSLAAPFNYEVAVSEAGMRRALSKQNPICAYEEELGQSLLPLGSANLSANDAGVKKVLTRLFDSGQSSKLGTKQASSAENTKDMVHMPCFTLAGDTQPSVYRGLLAPDMIDTGFAPRFVPFFYFGARSYHNKDSENHRYPHDSLVKRLRNMLEYCIRSGEAVVDVGITDSVQVKIDKLDRDYTDSINQSEGSAELYNRAAIIVQRVAALLAIGVNHLNPVIDDECYDYALACVNNGLDITLKMVESGGAGVGEATRLYHIKHALRRYLLLSPDQRMRSYKISKSLAHSNEVIPERYFVRALSRKPDFASKSDVRTSSDNVRIALAEAVKMGILEIAEPLIAHEQQSKAVYYRAGQDAE